SNGSASATSTTASRHKASIRRRAFMRKTFAQRPQDAASRAGTLMEPPRGLYRTTLCRIGRLCSFEKRAQHAPAVSVQKAAAHVGRETGFAVSGRNLCAQFGHLAAHFPALETISDFSCEQPLAETFEHCARSVEPN